MADLLHQPQPDRLRTALADRYQLERKLGEGGMATVYLARDLRHERQVALKVLRPELAASLGPQRFLDEIRVVANLQHPHILPLFDSGSSNGFLYYVMPFVEGESLRQRLLREPRLPLAEALRIAREAADALAYAHEQGVVHCDVKPENILLQKNHVLVADYGIARAANFGDSLSRGGPVIGTPQYMSPEQALGDADIDGRSDVYSLGCVLYEMLAGAPPFEGGSATTVVARHSLEQAPSLAQLDRSVPEKVQAAVTRALAKNRAERFQMRELAATLAQLNTDAKRAPVRRLRRIWTGLALTALGIGAFWLIRRSDTGKPPSSARAVAFDPRHIAVLYFQQRSRNDSLTYLADGLTEELIHQLSRVPTLQVISQNGVGPYRHTNVAPDSIARALKVGTLVQGIVAQSGGRLRLTVALIDGETGAELGSTTIERPHQEIFALQDDLTQEVAIFLRQRLGEEVQKKMAITRAETHPRAWHLVQQAGELSRDVDGLLAAGDTNGAAIRLDKADSLLASAQREEPKWSRPSVGRGRIAYARLSLVGTIDRRYTERWTSIGLVHAERAVRVNPEDAEALELRGTLRYYRWLVNLAQSPAEGSRLLSGAQTDLEAAVAEDPTAANAWTALSHLRMNQSQSALAKIAALRAYQADPYLASAQETIWRLFQSSLDLEDARESKRWCEEGHRRFPESYRFAECQLWLYALKGSSPDLYRLQPLYQKYIELTPLTSRAYNEHYGQMLVAVALARAGLRDSADAVARRARADTTIDETRELAMLEAIMRTLLGQYDEGLHQLSLYLSANPQFREGMARDRTWWFRDLRKDPRYQFLVGTTSQSAPPH
ncbi:MAG TPA: serine/threonine-protein kinase [Gemmatimonadales bacterium]|jgi:serine/threonine-protein kinase